MTQTPVAISAGAHQDAGKHAFIDDLIARSGGRPGALLGVLQAVQERNPRKYLCAADIEYVAAASGVPLSQIFSVVTFYALFNRDPQGDHTVCICRGTACHARGSRSLLETLLLDLGLSEVVRQSDADKLTLTTADGKFTIRTVACFGQCAMAPVIEVDHRICGHMNTHQLTREVDALGQESHE